LCAHVPYLFCVMEGEAWLHCHRDQLAQVTGHLEPHTTLALLRPHLHTSSRQHRQQQQQQQPLAVVAVAVAAEQSVMLEAATATGCW
jgi:hypothetical protein